MTLAATFQDFSDQFFFTAVWHFFLSLLATAHFNDDHHFISDDVCAEHSLEGNERFIYNNLKIYLLVMTSEMILDILALASNRVQTSFMSIIFSQQDELTNVLNDAERC